jgi:hypothetical protein
MAKLGSTPSISPPTATAIVQISKPNDPANFSFTEMRSSDSSARLRKKAAALSFPSRDI